MPQIVNVEMMDPEEAAKLLEAKQAENEAKERTRVAAVNRASGLAKPEPGDRLYVVTARGIPQRSRAGCLFKEMERTEVVVVDGDKPTGAQTDDGRTFYQVHVHGAELIIADNALTVTAQSASEADASDLRRQLAARDEEIVKLKAEHSRALREARMSAKDAGDGSPSRLIAARKVKGGSDPGFGGTE